MKRLLDPRTKLILLVLAAVYISLQLSIQVELLLICILVIPLFFAGLPLYGIAFIFVYAIQLLAFIFIMPLITTLFYVI